MRLLWRFARIDKVVVVLICHVARGSHASFAFGAGEHTGVRHRAARGGNDIEGFGTGVETVFLADGPESGFGEEFGDVGIDQGAVRRRFVVFRFGLGRFFGDEWETGECERGGKFGQKTFECSVESTERVFICRRWMECRYPAGR